MDAESSHAVVVSGRLRAFAAPRDQPRARRATDLVLLVVSAVGLALIVVAYPPSALERSLQRMLASIPTWLDPVWAFLSDLPWLWAALLVIVALVRRRLVVVGQALGAVALAALVGITAARIASGAWPDAVDAVLGTAEAARFPAVRLALATAVMLTVAPHFVRPLRVVDRWILLLGVIGTAAAGAAVPSGAVAAFLVGVCAAASVRLAWGTSIGRPGIADVALGLAELGVEARDLHVAERQLAGVFLVRGTGSDGRPLLVKIYGRDAYDTQLVAKLWRRLWYRGAGAGLRRSRLEAAEHEGLVTLLAANAGVSTADVVTAGTTVDGNAMLVLAGDARPLSALDASELDDAVLRDAWAALAALSAARISHGGLSPDTTVLVGSGVGFVDFADGVAAADEALRALDGAQLCMTTAALVGSERALAVASDVIGRRGVAALLPYLQDAALGTSLRRAVREAGVDVDEFRELAASTLDLPSIELVQLRRVTWRAVVQIALLGLASYAILSAAGGVDWEQFRATVSDASWGWVLVAFFVAQLPRLTQVLSTLGSVPADLPFGPVYAMQLATGYMNVALPSNLARMAVNVRFFQRQGLATPTAVAAGTIDSFVSTVVQAVLLVLLLLFSGSSLDIGLSLPTIGSRSVVWILAGVLLVAVAALIVVRRVRGRIRGSVRRWWPDVRAALVGLRSADKLALLVLGSLGTEILFATSLGLFARGFGYEISIAELLVVNLGVALLGSLVPVPGNIGVAEFGLMAGLVAAGMPDDAALATVLLYRISTFYLPPLWGFFALRWLQRNRHL